MHAIILTGKKGCGKTSTMTIVYEQLLNIYRCDSSAIQPLVREGDFRVRIPVGTKTIELWTALESPEDLRQALERREEPADVLLCSLDPSTGIPPTPHSPILIEKDVRDDERRHQIANIKDCEKILNLVEQTL